MSFFQRVMVRAGPALNAAGGRGSLSGARVSLCERLTQPLISLPAPPLPLQNHLFNQVRRDRSRSWGPRKTGALQPSPAAGQPARGWRGRGGGAGVEGRYSRPGSTAALPRVRSLPERSRVGDGRRVPGPRQLRTAPAPAPFNRRPQVLVEGLANSRWFQQFAIRSNKFFSEVGKKGVEGQSEVAEKVGPTWFVT